jgi:hypothetical protein
MSVNEEEVSVLGNTSGGEIQFSKAKKAKLSENLKTSDQVSNVSPILHHKLPFRSRNDDEDSDDSGKEDDSRAQTNLYGVNFLMWFEVGIEGKDSMDLEEEDWGKIEFGYQGKSFPTDMEDYFLLFEDRCSQSHTCAGRVMGIQDHVREQLLKPADYDPRDITT